MLAAGYDEVLLKRPSALDAVVPMHPHPSEVNTVIVAGEMGLVVEDEAERHRLPWRPPSSGGPCSAPRPLRASGCDRLGGAQKRVMNERPRPIQHLRDARHPFMRLD